MARQEPRMPDVTPRQPQLALPSRVGDVRLDPVWQRYLAVATENGTITVSDTHAPHHQQVLSSVTTSTSSAGPGSHGRGSPFLAWVELRPQWMHAASNPSSRAAAATTTLALLSASGDRLAVHTARSLGGSRGCAGVQFRTAWSAALGPGSSCVTAMEVVPLSSADEKGAIRGGRSGAQRPPVCRVVLGDSCGRVTVVDVPEVDPASRTGEPGGQLRWPLPSFDAHVEPVTGVAALPDSGGTRLVTVSCDGNVRIWRYASASHLAFAQGASWVREEINNFSPHVNRHLRPLTSVAVYAFGGDEQVIVFGGLSGALGYAFFSQDKGWEASNDNNDTGESLQFGAAIWDVAFGPYGDLRVSYGDKGGYQLLQYAGVQAQKSPWIPVEMGGG